MVVFRWFLFYWIGVMIGIIWVDLCKGLNEYLNPGFEKGICNQEIVKSIISEIGSLFEYKQFIKNASLSFADNKNNPLTITDFEF